MGFLGFGKKKEKDPLQALEELNMDNQSNNPYLQDQNPGDLGMSQNPNFSQDNQGMQNPMQDMSQDSQPQKFDSFGNPMKNPYDSQNQQMYNQQMQPAQGQDNSKDLQLIIAKLDAIKAEVSNISHRLEILEAQNRPNQQQPNQQKNRYVW